MELSPRRVGAQRKRLRRADNPGDARFLTFSCFRRQPLLSRERSCRWLLDAMDRARETHGFDLWAFVIMPEHVHLLVYPATPRNAWPSSCTRSRNPSRTGRSSTCDSTRRRSCRTWRTGSPTAKRPIASGSVAAGTTRISTCRTRSGTRSTISMRIRCDGDCANALRIGPGPARGRTRV